MTQPFIRLGLTPNDDPSTPQKEYSLDTHTTTEFEEPKRSIEPMNAASSEDDKIAVKQFLSDHIVTCDTEISEIEHVMSSAQAQMDDLYTAIEAYKIRKEEIRDKRDILESLLAEL